MTDGPGDESGPSTYNARNVHRAEHMTPATPQTVAETLQERAGHHGRFEDNANFSQHVKQYMRTWPAWPELQPEHREALDQIACKMSRILAGRGEHLDNWRDIAGYATLAEMATVKTD